MVAGMSDSAAYFSSRDNNVKNTLNWSRDNSEVVTTSTAATRTTTRLSAEELCMSDPHWYAFLCSSFITFFTGLLLVLSWRILAWLFCQRPGVRATAVPTAPDSADGWKRNDSEEGGGEVGWMTEAKDWAGELISGQTTTGRILVSERRSSFHPFSLSFLRAYFVELCNLQVPPCNLATGRTIG